MMGFVGESRREYEGPCANEISVFWVALLAKLFLSWSAMEPESVTFQHTHIKKFIMLLVAFGRILHPLL